MKTKLLLVVIFVIGFFVLLPEPPATSALKIPSKDRSESSQTREAENIYHLNENFVIKNVRLYDGDVLQEDMDVLIKAYRISAIGKDLDSNNFDLDDLDSDGQITEYDATGKTLLPGFIDSHTHVYGNALKDAINFGVTTELDMFTLPKVANEYQAKRDKLDNIVEADLFSSTILVTTEGGHGTEYGLNIPVIKTADQAQNFVRDRISEGADYVKVVYDSSKAENRYYPSISLEVLQSLVHAAHEQEKMLVVHVDNLISAKEAINTGADGIIHSFMDKVVDQEFVQLMIEKNAFIIPTLSVEASVAKLSDGERLLGRPQLSPFLSNQQKQQLKSAFPNFGVPSVGFQKALDSVKRLSDAGVLILAGTDAPNPGTSHGVSLHGELLLLVKAGLTNEQAIHAATGAARKVFPLAHRGKLKVGAAASMLLIDGNPFENITDTENISHIWKNGRLFKRVAVVENESANPKAKPTLITDFNQSPDQTIIGQKIMPSTDQMAGGKSIVDIQHKEKSSGDRFLKVSGEVKSGFMFPWSGLAFLPGESMQKGVDFSDIAFISFDAKASTKKQIVSVLVFQSGSFLPFEQKIQLSKTWQGYKIPLNEFGDVDLSDIVNLSIVISKEVGTFDFSLDNLKLE